jgi:hypothetical protein
MNIGDLPWKKIGVAAIIIVVIIIIVLFLFWLAKKYLPMSGSFAGFGAEYKNIGPYADVDPFVRFMVQNGLLADEYRAGTITIDKVSVVYGDFLSRVKAGQVDNAPMKIVKEVQGIMGYIATGQDFTIISAEPFRLVGQAIINIDRLCKAYASQLPFYKDKVGGTDPNTSKIYDDYIKANEAKDGYIQQFLNSAQLEEFATNSSKAAKYKEDVTEDLVISSMLDNVDPRDNKEHQYQEFWDDKHSGGSHLSSKMVYDKIDKRYPGTYDRRILEDEPYSEYEKDPKDPNVPRPGIIGKVADEPYHYDRRAGVWYRQY